jgi:acyl-CoA synthetase (AMP-forming)/AMP-acid ligase II
MSDASEPIAVQSAAGRLTVYSLFRTLADHAPDNPAIFAGDDRWTYGELLVLVDRLADAFAACGIGRGDRIAVLAENRMEYPLAQLAAAKLGAIVACQNWRLAKPELQHCLSLVTPKLVLVSARFRDALSALDTGGAQIFDVALCRSALGLTPARRVAADRALPEDPLLLLYTSGTTGLPKAAMVSHRAEIARMTVVRMDLGAAPGEAFVGWAPLFHIGGTDHMFHALLSGAPALIADGFDVPVIVDLLERHRIAWLLLVPGTIEQLADEIEKRSALVKGVRVVGCMIDLVPPALVARITGLLGASFLNSFGATETGIAPLSGNLIPSGVAPTDISKSLNSLCEFRLLDDDGNEVPHGETGEGAIRGPTVFSGYWNAPETNARDFATGFFRMGDLFRRLPNGRYDFVDRAKYMIKSGGENIYPAEIERVLLADPRVADAIVVKKKDAKWGEVPVAFVARRSDDLTAADIEAMCRRELAGFKRPKEVHFVAFDDLPRSTSGKILRHEMEKRL